MKNFDKEELILNNQDVNLSDYDKGLSYEALSGIISAKKNYAAAKKANDTIGMAKANAYANTIRRQSGGYEGGSDGSGYYPVASLKDTQRKEYKSAYTDDIDKIYKKITNRQEFEYDAESDPIFNLYKKIYEKAGNDAYERALATQSAKTGGIANSNAISSATQARAYYNNKLSEKAIDLYNDAYDKYNDETNELYNILKTVAGLDSTDYSRYRDEMGDFKKDREYEYNLYRYNNDSMNDYIDREIDYAYKKDRDSMDDYKWATEYQYQSDWQDKEFEYQKERDSMDDVKWYSQNKIDEYNTLSKLIGSIYNKSNVGVDIRYIMDLLGL